MAEDDLSPDARAISLVPPDPPPLAVRRVLERRVAGWRTTVRLANRVARRPAGNSRRFWSKMEAEDPFLAPPAGARLTDESHAMYPLDRVGRGDPPPAAPPQRGDAVQPRAPQPKARPPQPPPAPHRPTEPVHTPDPRAARAPQPPPRQPPEPEPQPALDRRVPKMPPPPRPQPGSWTARQQAQHAQQRPSPPAPPPGRPPASPPPKDLKVPPKGMSIDRAMSILAELKEAAEAAKRGEKLEEPPPAPRAVAPSHPRAPPPQARPAPAQPPRPAPPARPSPAPDEDGPLPPAPRPTGQGRLDDLFGGGSNEGRVRIGAPKKKTLE